jgi:hypothetical protein
MRSAVRIPVDISEIRTSTGQQRPCVERVAGASARDSLDRAVGNDADCVLEVELKTGVRLRVSTHTDLDYVVALVQRLR